jgi:hypothetical protein
MTFRYSAYHKRPIEAQPRAYGFTCAIRARVLPSGSAKNHVEDLPLGGGEDITGRWPSGAARHDGMIVRGCKELPSPGGTPMPDGGYNARALEEAR